jgi:hypothetical protein
MVEVEPQHVEVVAPVHVFSAFDWRTATRFAMAGVAVVIAAVISLGAGALCADWMVANIDIAKQYPVLASVLCTVVSFAVVLRAVPWRRVLLADPPGASATIDPDDAGDERDLWCDMDGDRLDGTGGDPVAQAATDLACAGSNGWLAARSTSGWAVTVAAVATVMTALIHRDVLGRLSTRTIGTSGDREWYVFLSWKIGQALADGSSPFRLEGMVAPHGYSVLVGDGFLPPMVGGLLNLVMGPIAAYNFLLMLGTFLAIVAGVVLARRVTAIRWIQLVTAVAIASAPVAYVRYEGHLSLCFAFPITLAVAEAVDIARGRPLRIARVSAWLLLAFGSSIYFLLIAGGVTAVAVVFRWVQSKDDRRQLVLRAAAALAVTLLVIAPFIVERTRFTNAELDAGSTFDSTFATDGAAYNADVLSIALPTYPTAVELPGTERFRRNIVAPSGEGNYSFPGLLLVVLGIGGLVAARRRERIPIAIAAVGLWVMTLGPVLDVYGSATVIGPVTQARVQWMPFKLLGQLPLMSGLRAPGRLSLGLPPMLGVGLAMALDRCVVIRRARPAGASRPGVAMGLAVAVLMLNVPSFTTTRPTVETTAGQAMLRSLGERPGRLGRVAPVPSCEGNLVGTDSSLQIWHGLEQVGCQGPYLALPFASQMADYRLSADLAALRCQPNVLGYVQTAFPNDFDDISDDLAGLRDGLGVRYLVIDKQYLPQCPRVAAVVASLRSAFTVLPGDDRWEAIDLDEPSE